MKLSIKTLALLALMLMASGLGIWLRPTISIADELPPINLKGAVPTAFGNWREQINLTNQIVDPQQQATLDKIYSEILARTYANSEGYRIMLSIAYGKNQSRDLQLHIPDICYPAQGFSVLGKQAGNVDVLGKSISAVRLETSLGQRFEPITYWTIVGDQITSSMTDKRLIEVRYAIRGRIPDGMLVRISSIDKGTDHAYAIQRQFAAEMIQAIAPENRSRFAGKSILN